MRLALSNTFGDRLTKRIGKYSFEVGVLTDATHKKPRVGERGKGGRDVLSSYAGGPIRKKSGKDSALTIAEVSAENRKRLGFNYLTAPFKKKDSQIIQFTREFLKMVFGKGQGRRVENLLQAVVRNPILRGEYGTNSPVTKKIKGFNRSMIDTAQLFKAIKARIVRRS